MNSRMAVIAGIAALAASPALGQAAKNADALDAHFASLSTSAERVCTNFDGATLQDRMDACQLALSQLAAARDAARGLSPGQTSNYDYKRVVLQTGLAATYAQTDKGLSARTCALIESNWAIREQLRQIPQGALSASAYDTYQNAPEQLPKLVAYCRDDFPAPAGAPPLPAAAQ